MFVIGTAGHVDHGKSTLVEALTGINPDRLKEERERQMTIDLGFAWLTLPTGQPIGIIDVPGHRDFIENMLAGVGGIDAALLVIAADEGVMPQTREHLAILDLLKIPAGVIALTKSDLVDAEWLSLLREEVAEVVRGTVLQASPVVPLSARTGAGLDDLRQALARVLAGRPPRPDSGQPFLPIDRVFTLAGFGTVVTGTLSGGSLALGDDVGIEPGGLRARVRGLQTYQTAVERVVPGSRVAANLVGVEVSDLKRGQVVAQPGNALPTTFFDARLDLFVGAPSGLKHNAEVKVFAGAAEAVGRVRLLGDEQLLPGAAGWAQLLLTQPVVVAKGQRFILRRPSPAETLAGGVVVDPHPARRHRRFQADVLSQLETLAQGTPGERLLQTLDRLGLSTLAEAAQALGLDEAPLHVIVETLKASDRVLALNDAHLITRANWERLAASLASRLSDYHAQHPLLASMPREELRNRLGADLPSAHRARWNARMFNAVLAEAERRGLTRVVGAGVALRGHQVRLTPLQQAAVDSLLADFYRDPYNTPSYSDCAKRVSELVLTVLTDQQTLLRLSGDVLFLPSTYAEMVQRLKDHLADHESVTVAQVRDLFGTSRKYVLAFLEHLDAQGITRRLGDVRVLRG